MADLRHVEGLRELVRALEDLPRKVATNGLRKAVSTGAALVRDEAKSRAPVDTGEMRRDIMIKRARTADGMIATYEVFVRTGKKSRMAGRRRNVARDSYYWRFVEFGTSKMAARPFMRPAFEAKKVEAVDLIKQTLREKIAEATR